MADVFVRGFDFGTTAQQVKKYCQQIGPVKDVELFGKGAAVVTFANAAHAGAAVKQLEGSTMPGQTRYIEVKLNEKQPKATGGKKRTLGNVDGPSCRVFVRGFDFGTTDEQFEGHMSQVGSIERVQWITKGSAIVVYSSPDEAEAAVANLNETTIEGNSRFIDVILKEAVDQGPPAKRAKGTGGGKAGGKGKGVWVFQPAGSAPARMGLGNMGFGSFGNAGKGGKGMRSDPPGSGRVFVRGFDFGTSRELVQSHMKRAGPILDIDFANKGSAVVIYKTRAAAMKAASALNGTTIQGNSRFIDVLLKDSE
jgi:RNA recognition motif-containing protein